jgi:hypothetical protein
MFTEAFCSHSLVHSNVKQWNRERQGAGASAPHYQSSAEIEHNNGNDEYNDNNGNANDYQFDDKQHNSHNTTMMHQLSTLQNK